MNFTFARAVSVVAASALLFSSSFAGVYTASETIGSALAQWQRGKPGHFTDSPRKPYLGAKPGKSKDRGGMWSKRALESAKGSSARADKLGLLHWLQNLQASLSPTPAAMPPMHVLAVAAEPGGSQPWEGSFGGVNSGNGNKLTSLNLFSWNTRGGMSVGFTLFHNSQTTYNDELGHGWTWTYDWYINEDTINGVATIHQGDGTCIPFAISGSNYIAPTGIFDTLVKNGNGTWTLTRKDQTKFHFNANEFLTQIEDKNGNTVTITLNGSNYATRVTDATGRYYDIALDGSNNFTSVTTPDGEVWEFTRNGSDDLTEIEWPTLDSVDYSDFYNYNASHDILTHTDKRGKVWTNTYNTDGSLATQKNPYNHTLTYTYGPTSTTFTNPLSKVVTHNYSSGKLASVVDEASFSTSQTLGGVNLPTSITDKRGKVWTYTYDSRGNVLTKTNPLSKVWEFTYDGDNNLLTSEDPLGNITEYTYDASGNLLEVEDPLNRATATNTFDAYGQLTEAQNALSKITEFGYDGDGNLTTIEDPLTHVTTIAYDDMGRVTSKTDAVSNVESVAYDEWGRPVTFTHPGSVTSLIAYDAEGNTTATTNELSKTTTYAFDDAGRLTSVTNAKSEVESYAYNSAGLRTTITNGRGKVSTYAYTDRGEVASLTLPDSSVETWSYNGNRCTSAYTNPLSQVIYYTYDDASRQTGIDYPTGTDVAFSYDFAGKRTQMTDSTGTTGWTYNAGSELTAFSSPQGNLSYTYTTAGQRATLVDGGLTSTYSYDDAGRMTSLQNGYSETTNFTYDNANRVTRKTYSSGQYDAYAYDSRSRATSVTLKNSSNATLRTNSYTYDNASQVATTTLDAVTTTFGYDDIGQLTSESRSGYSGSYTYDANGNRLTKTVGGVTEDYAYDDADKLSTVKIATVTQKSYGYDTAGRTTSVVTGAGTTTLAYDYEGRISTITYPSTATNTFAYNGLDTRVSKVDSAGTATYKRDGAGVTAPVLGDGGAVYTPGVSERRSSTTTFLHSGSKNADSQTGTGQTIAATKQYDAFGNTLSSTGTWKGPFSYAGSFGYQEDADSSLNLLGHRYYDPGTGRFLTRDPIKDGRNWYTYCDNNPVSRNDAVGFGWHDPLVISVSPGFVGTVIVSGEPGPGMPPVAIIVPPGYHSPPTMDVDHMIIINDGNTDVCFPPGLGRPNDGDDTPQSGRVNEHGQLIVPGPLFRPGPPLFDPVTGFWLWRKFTLTWLALLDEGLSNFGGGPAPIPGGYPGPNPEPRTGPATGGGSGSSNVGPGLWDPVGKGHARKEV